MTNNTSNCSYNYWHLHWWKKVVSPPSQTELVFQMYAMLSFLLFSKHVTPWLLCFSHFTHIYNYVQRVCCQCVVCDHNSSRSLGFASNLNVFQSIMTNPALPWRLLHFLQWWNIILICVLISSVVFCNLQRPFSIKIKNLQSIFVYLTYFFVEI